MISMLDEMLDTTSLDTTSLDTETRNQLINTNTDANDGVSTRVEEADAGEAKADDQFDRYSDSLSGGGPRDANVRLDPTQHHAFGFGVGDAASNVGTGGLYVGDSSGNKYSSGVETTEDADIII